MAKVNNVDGSAAPEDRRLGDASPALGSNGNGSIIDAIRALADVFKQKLLEKGPADHACVTQPLAFGRTNHRPLPSLPAIPALHALSPRRGVFRQSSLPTLKVGACADRLP